MKKILFILTIFTSHSVNSMEPENNNLNKITLTNTLHETEEQFIARTKEQGQKFSLEAYVHMSDHFPKNNSLNITRCAYCPDESKIVAVKMNQKKHPDFIIFDVKERASNATAIYQGKLRRHCYTITLSQSGDTVAFIYKKPSKENNYKYFLALQKIKTLGIKKLNIPKHFDISNAHIGFNKQDTHIIVHGKIDLGHGPTEQHLIFSLKKD